MRWDTTLRHDPGASIAVESACKADRHSMSPPRAAPAAMREPGTSERQQRAASSHSLTQLPTPQRESE